MMFLLLLFFAQTITTGPSQIMASAGSVSCTVSINKFIATMRCSNDDQSKSVDLSPGALYEAWELFSPGAYPGYAPAGPAEKVDGISVFLARKQYAIIWRAIAKTANGQAVVKEGQF